MNKNVLINTFTVLFSLHVSLIDGDHSVFLCPDCCFQLPKEQQSLVLCHVPVKKRVDSLKPWNLVSPACVSFKHTARRKGREEKNRREANMFRDGAERIARHYISISLISISRKNGNTDNL